MEKEVLKSIIMDQQQDAKRSLRGTIVRNVDASLLSLPEIVIITGVRRCGKSVVMQQWRDQLSERDYYLNFDDDRLVNFTIDDFQTLYECFIELFGKQHTFFFDEIQNIDGWEQFVRRLYNGGAKVIVTGSNAHMLSRELGTRLTGRYVSLPLYPFSFVEYLTFKGADTSSVTLYTTEGRVAILSHFRNYMSLGGFPGYIRQPNGEYLSSLYQSLLYRDVITRNNISNERELMQLVYFLASNTAKRFSYSSLAKAVGIKHVDTVKNYVDALEQTYLVFQLLKYDPSVKKQLLNTKKIYFIDTAITSRIGFNPTSNSGQQFENMVFLELKRRGYELYYHAAQKECDFVVRQDGRIVAAYQVTIAMGEEGSETYKRELDGLLEALGAYGLAEGWIITLDDAARDVRVGEHVVHILPAWKWMLGQ